MIEKITDQNLERYDSRLKEWCDRKFFEKGNYGKYQTTEEAGAVAFYPAPDTPLEGKVKFSFKETPPASGDKGPENPSVIEGVSSIALARCGKNFYVYSGNKTVNGITFTDNGDGSITANGTATETATYRLSINPNASFWLKSGIPYYLSGCPSGGSSSTYYVAQYNGVGRDIGNGLAILLNESKASAADIVIYTGYTASDLTFWPQLELGTSATSFEKSSTDTYPISLPSTFYGGTLDVASGKLTVTWAHQTVTGGATNLTTIDASTLQFRFSITSGNHIASDTTNLACNRFIPGSTLLTTGYASQLYYARIAKSLLDASGAVDPSNPTDAEWLVAINSWLSSNNIEIAYKLATPYTVQLSPTSISSLSQTDKYTPRLNTVYTDADSVQISYLKSPIRDEYEKTQAILSLGGNS